MLTGNSPLADAAQGKEMAYCDFWLDPKSYDIISRYDLKPNCCMRLGGPGTCLYSGQGQEGICDLYEPHQEITWKEVKTFFTKSRKRKSHANRK